MGRGNQMVRQWRLLRLLEGHRQGRGLTPRELWEALGQVASERTVFRDLADLQAAGFALASDEGRWRALSASKDATALPLDASEVVALQLAAEAIGPAAPPPVGEALEGLSAKLSALLTPVGRRFVDSMRHAGAASHALPDAAAQVGPVAAVVHEAIQKQQTLRLRYTSPRSGTAVREVDPYTHWCFEGRAYVIGHCHLRGAVRVFLLARVQEAELTDACFEVDPAFEPRQHVAGGFGVWLGERHGVALVFGPESAHLARERLFHAEQTVLEQTDGSVQLELQVAGLPALARWLAGTGGAVRVLRPKVLAEMVQEIHARGLEVATLKPQVRAGSSSGPRRATAVDE